MEGLFQDDSRESDRLVEMLWSTQGFSSKVLVEESIVRTKKANIRDELKVMRILQRQPKPHLLNTQSDQQEHRSYLQQTTKDQDEERRQ